MGKDKSLNPMEAYRRDQKKKELKKQKQQKESSKEIRSMLNDPQKIENEIQKLQKESDENRLDKSIKDRIVELKRMKTIALTKQQMDIAYGKKPGVAKDETEKQSSEFANPIVAGERTKVPAASFGQHNSLAAPPQHSYQQYGIAPSPHLSVYYHPVYNPTGQPPPGQMPMFRPPPPPMTRAPFMPNSGGIPNRAAPQILMGGMHGIPLPPPRATHGIPRPPMNNAAAAASSHMGGKKRKAVPDDSKDAEFDPMDPTSRGYESQIFGRKSSQPRPPNDHGSMNQSKPPPAFIPAADSSRGIKGIVQPQQRVIEICDEEEQSEDDDDEEEVSAEEATAHHQSYPITSSMDNDREDNVCVGPSLPSASDELMFPPLAGYYSESFPPLVDPFEEMKRRKKSKREKKLKRSEKSKSSNAQVVSLLPGMDAYEEDEDDAEEDDKDDESSGEDSDDDDASSFSSGEGEDDDDDDDEGDEGIVYGIAQPYPVYSQPERVVSYKYPDNSAAMPTTTSLPASQTAPNQSVDTSNPKGLKVVKTDSALRAFIPAALKKGTPKHFPPRPPSSKPPPPVVTTQTTNTAPTAPADNSSLSSQPSTSVEDAYKQFMLELEGLGCLE